MNESRGSPSRRPLAACALATPPEVQPPRSKRRMSRAALVTLRRRSDHDKTRVSSINKRRVISVPEGAAASAGVETPGLDRIGGPLEVWTRRPPVRVARPRSSVLSRRSGSPPLARSGLCPFGRRRSARIAIQTSLAEVRSSADERESSRSRSRRPASQRTSPDSEPSVDGIHRLITGRDRGAASIAPARSYSLDFSQAACASPGTPHDDVIPVDLALRTRRGAPRAGGSR